MTVLEFLKLVEKHPFIIVYYAFSMILSILLGRLFLEKLGHPRIWNYFFSLLLYVLCVLGLISLILFFFHFTFHPLKILPFYLLIPFITMIVSLWLIYRRVNMDLLSGFHRFWIFLFVLLWVLIACVLIDYTGWIKISNWPVYLFLLFLVFITVVIQQISQKGLVFWR